MVQELSTLPSIFGRLGKGIGEAIPKEVERNRLASGLKNLGEQKGLNPFQQYAGLVGVAHEYPQVVQGASDLLRQQAIIDSINQNREATRNQPPVNSNYKPFGEPKRQTPSATTLGSTEAELNPYIPPSGPEQEEMSRQLFANEPRIYPTLDAARAAIQNQIQGNLNESNAKLNKGNLERGVQDRTELGIKNQINQLGANIPSDVLTRLQKEAIEKVVDKEMTPEQAKNEYGEIAKGISEDFSNIASWGGLSLINNDQKDLFTSIKALQKRAKEGKYQKQAADAMIADNNVTPQFAYSAMYPVRDKKELNDLIKSLPNINYQVRGNIEKGMGAPGLAGLGPKQANPEKKRQETLKIIPKLARAMGQDASPLSIAYELRKKGYDDVVWKDYLDENQKELNLGLNQLNELQKPQPSFFGALNDWWFRAFTGVQ